MSNSLFMACAPKPTRILVVDDEGAFRESLAEMLRDDGHEVLDYSAPAEVPPLDRLSGIDVVVTDYEMPGKNGLAFADEFHAHRPGVPILLVTADASDLDVHMARRPFLRMMQKPIGYDALHRAIHECARPNGA